MSKILLVVGVVVVALLGVTSGSAIKNPSSYTEFREQYSPKATRGQEIIGPIEWDCVGNGAFPYPECDKYVDCWEGQALLGQCTDLMLFDLSYNGCNFAQNVDCGTRFRPTDVPGTVTPPVSTTTSNVSTTTTEGPPLDFVCPSDGVFQHDTKCEYYWECYVGIAALHHCQLDYLFDLEYMGCNFPQLTHCQERERPPGVPGTTYPPVSTVATTQYTGPTTTTDVPSGDFTCLNDGVFPNEERCEYYWSCYIGVATLIKCDDDYLYDLEYDGCNFPEYTHCQNRTRPPGVKPTAYPPISTTTKVPTTEFTGPTTTRDPTAPTTTSAGPFVCPTPEGNFADPADCTGFYQCSGDVAYHQTCPDGLYYNPDIDNCDFPANVKCDV